MVSSPFVVGCDSVTSCPEMMPRVNACLRDSTSEVRGFDDELATELAANPQCKGVRLAWYNGPSWHHHDKATDDAMRWPIDFIPGATSQWWSLQRSSSFYKGVARRKWRLLS